MCLPFCISQTPCASSGFQVAAVSQSPSSLLKTPLSLSDAIPISKRKGDILCGLYRENAPPPSSTPASQEPRSDFAAALSTRRRRGRSPLRRDETSPGKLKSKSHLNVPRQLSQKVSTRAEQMTAEIQPTQMQGQEHEQEDRISELQDHILMDILDRLEDLRDVVRTCVLSKRWRHVPGLLSKIVLDVAHFQSEEISSDYASNNELAQANVSLVQATKSILAHKSQHTINYLSIKFLLRDESIDIVRSVDNAMATREVTRAYFIIIPETLDTSCMYGRRFMTFLDGHTRAFGGLTGLCLYYLRLGKFDMSNVLSACKKLEHLILNRCDVGIGSVLQIEHPQLSQLSIIHCACERIELNQLPRLTHLTCQSWPASHDTCPLAFGYVPKLSVLILSSMSSVYHRNIRLSELLHNVVIVNLDLNFQCRKIWIQPEATRPLVPLLRNLQMLRLRFIYEKCDLSWTMFILEAAPLLEEINIQVWDHVCNEKDMSREEFKMQREIYRKESNHLSWEAHDFKHYNLRKLKIEGFQVEEKLKRYIRQVLKAAVNLELVSLRKSLLCGKCRFRPSSMAYPRNGEEKDLIRMQISDQTSSNARIMFSP